MGCHGDEYTEIEATINSGNFNLTEELFSP